MPNAVYLTGEAVIYVDTITLIGIVKSVNIRVTHDVRTICSEIFEHLRVLFKIKLH